jgi:hypothetical protein
MMYDQVSCGEHDVWPGDGHSGVMSTVQTNCGGGSGVMSSGVMSSEQPTGNGGLPMSFRHCVDH